MLKEEGDYMKRKNIKMINLILILIFIFTTIQTPVLAEYRPEDLTGKTPEGETEIIKNLGNQIIGIIQAIGVVVSVVVIIILGIKYMLGSVDQKAEYKKTMLPYVIGSALIFSASTISYIIMNVIKF